MRLYLANHARNLFQNEKTTTDVASKSNLICLWFNLPPGVFRNTFHVFSFKWVLISILIWNGFMEYQNRLPSKMTYFIPQVRTNYGTFNITFQGAKVWNDISDDIKLLPLQIFKKNLKLMFLVFCDIPSFFFFFCIALCVCVSVLCVSVWALYLTQIITLDKSPKYCCFFF